MTAGRRTTVAAALLTLLVAACGGSATSPTAHPTSSGDRATAPPDVSAPTAASRSPSAAPASPTPETSVAGSPSFAAADSPAPSRSTSAKASTALDLDSLQIDLTPFAEGLESPVLVTHASDGSGTLYVAEQTGRVRTVTAEGAVGNEPFLDISDRVRAGGEQGLLGLAFHPEYRSNGRLFVDYTDRNGDTVVAEYRASDGRADAGSERVLLMVDQPYANHNGGHVAFGPDGFLYVALGDGGSGGDPQNNGQRRDTLLGKILRISVDPSGGRPYGIPRDNPFVGRSESRPEIWDLGLRNPWRFSFDRAGGALYIGDVGQGQYEEIDAEPRGEGGRNYGWRITEGAHCYETESCGQGGLTPPVGEYDHKVGCSVTGGYVYRGREHAALLGAYLFADYCSGTIWALDAAAALRGPTEIHKVAETDVSISSFGEDEAGELYVIDHGGSVLRVGTAGGG